jgi:hypothetical protein
MKTWLMIIGLLAVTACENRLSDEQRKAMRENMELHKIKKVSDVEITEAAYQEGRSILKQIEQAGSDSLKINGILKGYNGRVRLIRPGKDNARAMEQQLIDAYLADESGNMQDNVQKIRTNSVETDSILYTKPAVVKLSDGSERLEGMWSIWLSKKEIIIRMKK